MILLVDKGPVTLKTKTGLIRLKVGDMFRGLPSDSTLEKMVNAGILRQATPREVINSFIAVAKELWDVEEIDNAGQKTFRNMYRWIDKTVNYLAGRCPHECFYCYVRSLRYVQDRYTGKLRLIDSAFLKSYEKDKIIFICDCNDLFGDAVPDNYIAKVVAHCNRYPETVFCFQTKNPARFHSVRNFPPKVILGATIETNRHIPASISKAPQPEERVKAMVALKGQRFVTIEPIMDFDLDPFVNMIVSIAPTFVNIGADSKRHKLIEPAPEKVRALIDELNRHGVQVKQKSNLFRILGQ